ncbi:MAG TPA: hypothetical protein VH247_07545 [Thermoleophilaceae bacterium]|jgi:hypothetical protein|nr:hypothetical protein [Thermoleophilaceae bacterium]
MLAALAMTAVIGCAHQSGAEFPGAYRDPANLSVGPLAWAGARAHGDADGSLGGGFRWKQPVLVRPGHTVTIRVAAPAASFARLSYAHAGGWAFRGGVRKVVFRACSATKAMSRTDGRPVTFWSGGIVATRGSICLPVEIRIDRGPVRRRTIALNARCPG